jgi:hypothetical protein
MLQAAMLFKRHLHPGIRSGEISCTVRIWKRCHVRVGGSYALAGGGYVEVDSVEPIELTQITGELARRCGFKGVIDLLKVARHGRGENVYLITFHYCRTVAAAGGPRGSPISRMRRGSAKPRR